MGNDCCTPQLPTLDPKHNPYSAVGAGAQSNLIVSKSVPSSLAPKFQFQSKGPVQKLTSQESKEIALQMITPVVTAPIIQAPELQVSGIRTQSYLNTLQAAVQEQQKERILQFQMLQQQAMLQAQLEQQKRIQMEQERQLAIKQQKEALILQHGPAPTIASPVDIPPVSKQINDRRKQLQMIKYEGEAKGVMLNPFKFNSNGFVYFGQWNNGQPHGKGLIYFADGSVFEGGFVNGKTLGKGRLISQNGDYYQGEVLGNSASGKGVSQNSLVRYQGMFQNNIPHGQGVETTLDGKSKFVGLFEAGNKKQGRLTWGDNHQYSYQGTFANDLFEGEGVLKSQGGIYRGTFHAGKKHGKGIYQWFDGRSYNGEYIQDVKSGYGELYNSDGSLSYQGAWKDDYPNGVGTTVSNGLLVTGEWVNGEFLG